MQYKLNNYFKKMMKGILFSIPLLFVQSIPMYADTGDLKINNQVIYEKNEGSQNHSTTFTIPQLFMDDMSMQDKQLGKEALKVVADAQKEVFLKKTPKQSMIGKEITPKLFSKDYVLTDDLESITSKDRNGSSWEIRLVLVIGGLFVVCLGVLLGRAFPRWLRKR